MSCLFPPPATEAWDTDTFSGFDVLPKTKCPIQPLHIWGALLQKARQLQFSAWLGTDSRGRHCCLPMGTATSGPTIQRRRQHFLVNETPAIEGGMWVPKSPCLVYHHRLDDGADGFQRGPCTNMARGSYGGSAMHHLCYPFTPTADKGTSLSLRRVLGSSHSSHKAQVPSGPHPEDPSKNSQRA